MRAKLWARQMSSTAFCEGCFEKQRLIDQLEEENLQLKMKLRYQERRAAEGFFGLSTSSAKQPVKANTKVLNSRFGGAKAGHVGHGRSGADPRRTHRVQKVEGPDVCPDCGASLQNRGIRRRTIIDCPQMKTETIVYQLSQKQCPKCGRHVSTRAPGVLPKCLYSNRLLTHVLVQHYVYGVPLGRLEDHLSIGYGSLIQALHRLASLFEKGVQKLVEAYRQAPVKHADETGWRTDGHNGYAWLFCSPTLSIFRIRNTRSARVPKEIFGKDPVPGTLVVDRYNAYNKLPCNIEYCYAHLLREVKKLEEEFQESPEISSFVARTAPLLSSAMRLRSLPMDDCEFKRQACKLKQNIIETMKSQAQHPGIQRIQDIFRHNENRLYHWARDRNIPADNNFAERELRPLVTARKVSFGSQSERGAKTREILMSITRTLKKRYPDFQTLFTSALDQLAFDPSKDPYDLLFHSNTS